MATLSKQHGRYFVQFYHKDRKPKRKRVSLRTGKKRDAEAFRSKLEHDYVVGRFDPWTDDPLTYDRAAYDRSDVTSGDALRLFLDCKKEQGKKQNTVNAYRWFIDPLLREIGKGTLLRDVPQTKLAGYVHDTAVAKSTRDARFRHVRAFFRWAEREAFIDSCPTHDIEPPEKPEKLPKSITEAELLKVCLTLRPDYNGKLRRNACREGELVWQIPLYRFAFYTGMRASELARLRWDDVDYEKRLIRIYKQKNKKGRPYR